MALITDVLLPPPKPRPLIEEPAISSGLNPVRRTGVVSCEHGVNGLMAVSSQELGSHRDRGLFFTAPAGLQWTDRTGRCDASGDRDKAHPIAKMVLSYASTGRRLARPPLSERAWCINMHIFIPRIHPAPWYDASWSNEVGKIARRSSSYCDPSGGFLSGFLSHKVRKQCREITLNTKWNPWLQKNLLLFLNYASASQFTSRNRTRLFPPVERPTVSNLMMSTSMYYNAYSISLA
jgi:hypothetical protein